MQHQQHSTPRRIRTRAATPPPCRSHLPTARKRDNRQEPRAAGRHARRARDVVVCDAPEAGVRRLEVRIHGARECGRAGAVQDAGLVHGARQHALRRRQAEKLVRRRLEHEARQPAQQRVARAAREHPVGDVQRLGARRVKVFDAEQQRRVVAVARVPGVNGREALHVHVGVHAAQLQHVHGMDV